MILKPAYDDRGLLPTVVQDVRSGDVLMLAYANEASMAATFETGLMHFWSRSRHTLWMKGETSGNTLAVVDLRLDCDSDALLARVDPAGPVCHTGAETCFGPIGDAWSSEPLVGGELHRLWRTIQSRAAARPANSYTAALLDGGVDACGRKVAEEATELLLAAKDHAVGSGPAERVVEEAADVVYHLLVLLAERGIPFDAVEEELAGRAD
jgi:phosphoribosyl-ATP pyrophosphohydrolase/phosphoribosyl-AMP cyclohydrolase